MNKEKGREPSKKRFFLTLSIFYGLFTLILYIINSIGYLQISTTVTLFGIIVGSSVPAFLAVYLSRYSDQARVSRKQELLIDIDLRNKISAEREKHYKEVSSKLLELKKTISPFKIRIINEYPTNPLLVDELNPDIAKELADDTSIKNHMDKFKTGSGNFSIKKLASLLEESSTVREKVKEFENSILSKLEELLNISNSIVLNNNPENTRNKTCIGTNNLIIVLDFIWIKFYKTENATIDEFINGYFPGRPNATSLKNATIGDWDISTPNLKFQNSLNITDTDNLIANYDVLDIMKTLIVDSSLRSTFNGLYIRKEAIDEYTDTARNLIEGLIEKISSGIYGEVYNCCPYPEIDLSRT